MYVYQGSAVLTTYRKKPLEFQSAGRQLQVCTENRSIKGTRGLFWPVIRISIASILMWKCTYLIWSSILDFELGYLKALILLLDFCMPQIIQVFDLGVRVRPYYAYYSAILCYDIIFSSAWDYFLYPYGITLIHFILLNMSVPEHFNSSLTFQR